MGIYASVIVFPPATSQSGDLSQLERDVRAIASAFADRGFVARSVVERLTHDANSTFATGGLFEDQLSNRLPQDLEWRHFYIDATDVEPAIESILWTQTVHEFWEGLELPAGQNPSNLMAPHIDIMAFSRDVEIVCNVRERVVARTSRIIEFSFNDCRLSDEIHRIRDFKHPLFADFARIFARPMTWDYRAG